MSQSLRIEGLEKRLGTHLAVTSIDLEVPAGAFSCLLGPSGCGKTTLLRLVGGYLAPDAGRILLDGRDVTRLPPERRGMGMVFQDYALFPHMSARENVAFGLRVRGIGARERGRRVEEILDRIGLATGERGRRPSELSGGQRQRVALARALVFEPAVLLLDEPLANLDRRLRERMRDELRELQRRTGVTTLLVTHDQEEALSLATQVAVMRDGRCLQVGAPQDVYARPRDAFVARFLGDANLLRVVDSRDGRVLLEGGLSAPSPAVLRPGQRLLARPEHVVVGAAAKSLAGRRSARVTSQSFLGADVLLELRLEGGTTLRARSRGELLDGAAVGSEVDVALSPLCAWALSDSEARPEDDEHERRDS